MHVSRLSATQLFECSVALIGCSAAVSGVGAPRALPPECIGNNAYRVSEIRASASLQVSALLERYRVPLLRLFDHFCGTAPNAFAMLTPDGAPAPIAPHMQPAAVGPEASAEANEADAAGSGRGSRGASMEGMTDGGQQGINVEEFLLFCRTMDLCPALVSDLSLRYGSSKRVPPPP